MSWLTVGRSGSRAQVTINRLYSWQLDSIANYLTDCPVILLDCRGYPRDSQFGSHLASYIAHKPDTVALNRFPFLYSPNPSQQLTSTEYQIIQPSRNALLKHKRYILLVDEGVQSQGEGNVISLQGVSQSITVGTPTAGANGMAITLKFPGQYFSFFSGFGEYYPDNTLIKN
ncbi:S41 family peptidase [Spirosoma koreense]